MAKERLFEIQIKLTTEEQQRSSKFALPLDMAIRSGALTGDATAGIAEMVRNLTSGLNENAGQRSLFSELLRQHEEEAEAEKRGKTGSPDDDLPPAA